MPKKGFEPSHNYSLSVAPLPIGLHGRTEETGVEPVLHSSELCVLPLDDSSLSTQGEIRTRTVQILSLLPPSDWATWAFFFEL